jgi:hypothetical protein
VGQRELGRAGRLHGQPAIRGQAAAGPEGELQSRLEIEERYRAVLELGADDALRGEAKAVAVESDGAFQVVDPEGDEGDAWLHGHGSM